MSLATVGSHHVCLGLTANSRKDWNDLLGASVSEEGLSRLISFVDQRLRMEEERRHDCDKKGASLAQSGCGFGRSFFPDCPQL